MGSVSDEADIVETAISADRFKTLVAAVKAAGLVDTLKGPGSFTVFAPTDEAFARLPKGTVDELLRPESRQRLTEVLTYHVVPGKVKADQAAKLSSAKAVSGRKVDITFLKSTNPRRIPSRLMVGDAKVERADIEADNGVIHAIDSVLIPSSLSRREAEEVLVEAIEKGVPAFNGGDAGKCADLYMDACERIVKEADADVKQGVTAILDVTVTRAKAIHEVAQKAWHLRHGMDMALYALRNM